jgi:hypothetical protein
MSLFAKLMIGGWTSTIAVIAGCALRESGKWVQIRESIALWLGTSIARVQRTPDKFQAEKEDAA